ncbi:hypothetical protein [Paenibacillus lutimineralis]|uniref:Uncharacterized protein n=1 Tax=Paenibacillus lutimineralis TaxID=2707005 RepID=A0A3Q9ID37_9BACL|nr:hypothetical protein [Paenibacillus lutimineralis]AZS16464.1 hypothetical protein EI981_19755 [Paenibacillus lutimineralis]
MNNGVVDFGPFTNDVFIGAMTINQARDKLNSLDMSESEEKRYDTILVVGKDIGQAKFLWRIIRDKYPKESRVKFIDKDWQLDGLCPWTMLIIFVGEYWLNPTHESRVLRMYQQRGADVVYEEV